MEFEWVLVCFLTVWIKARSEWPMGRKNNTDTWPRLEEGQEGPSELRDPKGCSLVIIFTTSGHQPVLEMVALKLRGLKSLMKTHVSQVRTRWAVGTYIYER